jgi:hypothetical protein
MVFSPEGFIPASNCYRAIILLYFRPAYRYHASAHTYSPAPIYALTVLGLGSEHVLRV